MFELLISGGFMMFPLILCSILAMAIVCERLWALRRSHIIPLDVSRKVLSWIHLKKKITEDQLSELQVSSPLGYVLAVGLTHIKNNQVILKQHLEESGRHVVHSLERYLNMLGTIATITPLLGLLGTVVGMIEVFTAIMTQGVGNAGALAGGISQALLTTATGLSIAILSLIFHRHFQRKIDGLAIDLEHEAMKVVNSTVSYE